MHMTDPERTQAGTALDRAPARSRPGWRVIAAVAAGVAAAPVVAWALPHGLWAATLAYHAVIALGVMAVAPARLGARPLGWRLGVAALGVAAAVAAAAFAVRPMWDFTPAFARWREWGLAFPHAIGWLAYYALVNPWVEELYWRGTLCSPAVGAHIGRRAALVLASGGFVGHHAVVLVATWGPGPGVALCMPVLAAGIAFTLLRVRTAGLWWPLATHMGADVGLACACLAFAAR
jgi:membrane protease YdiL (CAAX protease family)